MAHLGTIQNVNPREVWRDEAQDFTPWLASEDGLTLLSETLGLDLELDRTESRVGPFRADIVARIIGEEEDVFVVVENQLEKTNHDHLGKLITYAAGLSAKTIVWISSGFTDEHRQALDWLNENTPDLNFFGLQIEVLRIGDSLPAPQLRMISSPNEWAKAVKIERARELSETKLDQLRFWEDLQEYARRLPHTPISLGRKPRPQHWYNLSIGRSGFRITLTVNSVANRVGAEVFIYTSEIAKKAFDLLYEQKDAIEAEFGVSLEWQRLDDRIGSRIALYKEGDFLNPGQREELMRWLYEQTAQLHRVLSPRIRALDL